MAGLGLFIFGAMSAVCGIGRAIENKQMKDYSSKIDEQGRPTWIDREGKMTKKQFLKNMDNGKYR